MKTISAAKQGHEDRSQTTTVLFIDKYRDFETNGWGQRIVEM